MSEITIDYIRVNNTDELLLACKQLNVLDWELKGFFLSPSEKYVVARISSQDHANIVKENDMFDYANYYSVKTYEIKLNNSIVTHNDLYCNCNNRIPSVSYILTSSFTFCKNCKKEIL
jgi:hypothetical protein